MCYQVFGTPWLHCMMETCADEWLLMPVVTLSPVMCTIRQWAFMRGLYARGYAYMMRCDTVVSDDVANVMVLLDTPAKQAWEGWTSAIGHARQQLATLCMYARRLARPAGLQQPSPVMDSAALCLLHAHIAAPQDGDPVIAQCGGPAHPGLNACASGAVCMLFIMWGTLCSSVLPCMHA